MDCVQIFTKNQRQWQGKALGDAEVRAWRDRLAAVKWHTPSIGDRPASRTVSHNSYLINLASPSREAWEKSIAAQRDELQRCERLGIPFLVAHPGGHLGAARPARQPHDLRAPPTPDEQAGLARIVAALDQLHAELPGYQTITCLELTAGSGTHLGYSFEHLRLIRESVRQPERVAFCFDTCHAHAAGYDMTTGPRAAEVLDLWGDCCGCKHLRVVHLNDSQGSLGSRLDRHAAIGAGQCGRACFQALVNHPSLREVPMILETPKGEDDEGMLWDVVNLRRLRRMVDRRGAPSPPGRDQRTARRRRGMT